jgi:hypothetical protein
MNRRRALRFFSKDRVPTRRPDLPGYALNLLAKTSKKNVTDSVTCPTKGQVLVVRDKMPTVAPLASSVDVGESEFFNDSVSSRFCSRWSLGELRWVSGIQLATESPAGELGFACAVMPYIYERQRPQTALPRQSDCTRARSLYRQETRS